jgi:hypothetical protein
VICGNASFLAGLAAKHRFKQAVNYHIIIRRKVLTVDFSSFGTFNWVGKVSDCTEVNFTTNHTRAYVV